LSRRGTEAIIAVADGHGSHKAINSKKGAEFAAKICAKVCNKIETNFRDNPSNLKRDIISIYSKEIVTQWNNHVDQDIIKLHTKRDNHNDVEIGCVTRDAYGTTLLSALITPNYGAYLQLGDGDIVVIDAGGSPRRVIPHDPNHLGNQTDSLCSNNAWQNFRVEVDIFDQNVPQLVMISTDGYSNSFKNDDDFLIVPADILKMIKENGINWVASNLENWLSETSMQGSGDDITATFIVNSKLVNDVQKP
jgi:serine/threonine protein phosphatase PrpC